MFAFHSKPTSAPSANLNKQCTWQTDQSNFARSWPMIWRSRRLCGLKGPTVVLRPLMRAPVWQVPNNLHKHGRTSVSIGRNSLCPSPFLRISASICVSSLVHDVHKSGQNKSQCLQNNHCLGSRLRQLRCPSGILQGVSGMVQSRQFFLVRRIGSGPSFAK